MLCAHNARCAYMYAALLNLDNLSCPGWTAQMRVQLYSHTHIHIIILAAFKLCCVYRTTSCKAELGSHAQSTIWFPSTSIRSCTSGYWIIWSLVWLYSVMRCENLRYILYCATRISIESILSSRQGRYFSRDFCSTCTSLHTQLWWVHRTYTVGGKTGWQLADVKKM